MGKTLEKVFIRNLSDTFLYENGHLKESEIRKIEIEAIVDTGAAYLCLPPKAINELGLPFAKSKPVTTGNGRIELKQFRGAEITIQDRTIEMQVMQNKDDTIPALIGFLVLEEMDLIVDTKKQKLIGNPEHNGEWIIDMY